MIEGTASESGSRRHNVRRGLALVGSLFFSAWLMWFAITPAGAGPTGGAGAPDDTTTSSVVLPTTPSTSPSTTPSTTPTTTPTTRPPATNPPATNPPPTYDDPPDTEPEEEDDPPVTEAEEEEEEEAVEPVVEERSGPITTTINLLRRGDGTPGSETAQAPEEPEAEGGSASDEDRVIWVIIAALGAVALLVALLTWRYWLLTRPGLDLSGDDPDDGGYDGGYDDGGGGGGFYGGPSAPPGDPYATAAAQRAPDVNPMTTGMPPAPASGGWQDPQSPRQPAQRPPRGADRDAVPPPPERPQQDGGRRGRPARAPEADPFSAPAPPPQRGRGRGRRGGGADPFGWDDVAEQPPRRQAPPAPERGEPQPPPLPGRRRPEERNVRDTDAWGRNPGG